MARSSVTTLAREVVMLSEFGLVASRGLAGRDDANAELLKPEKQMGQLAAGFDADLLVVAGSPLQDIRTCARPAGRDQQRADGGGPARVREMSSGNDLIDCGEAGHSSRDGGAGSR